MAIVDTGLLNLSQIMYRDGQSRVLGHYDATRNKVWQNPLRHSDDNGHGGHFSELTATTEIHSLSLPSALPIRSSGNRSATKGE